MTSYSITPTAALPMVLVLVTDQFRCKRLITAGKHLADEGGLSLQVINVASPV